MDVTADHVTAHENVDVRDVVVGAVKLNPFDHRPRVPELALLADRGTELTEALNLVRELVGSVMSVRHTHDRRALG